MKTLAPETQLYLERLGQLYDWASRVASPFAQASKGEDVGVDEDGGYQAPSLVLSPTSKGTRPVRLVPRGHGWFGTEGRVDVTSDFGKEVLLFLGEEALKAQRPLLLRDPASAIAGEDDVLSGWVLKQSSRTGLNPSLSRDLLGRVFEAMSR